MHKGQDQSSTELFYIFEKPKSRKRSERNIESNNSVQFAFDENVRPKPEPIKHFIVEWNDDEQKCTPTTDG